MNRKGILSATLSGGTATATPDCSFGGASFAFRNNTALRFTMQSGSVTLDYLSIDATDGTFLPLSSVTAMFYHADVEPVPEP